MSAKSTEENLSVISDPSFEKAFRYFCRHLVSLSGWYYSNDPNDAEIKGVNFFAYSGFIFSINNNWFWGTAGHILEGLEFDLKNNSIKVKECFLVDCFGNEAISYDPIPFDYENSQKFFVNDIKAGLDIGFIPLSIYYQNLLKANGVIPIQEKNWIYQNQVEFSDHYIIIGLPKKLIKIENHTSLLNKELRAFLLPAMLPITRLDKFPNDLLETEYPRFVGKLKDDLSVNYIKGMSGGPIIGFNKEKTRYWIVAIQSSKLDGSDLDRNKIVFACPLPIFASLVENIIHHFNEKEQGNLPN